ncbi:Anthranilate synthase, amidotransferase component [Croceitalea dokdonensis DOKDO 023]|uniref:Anthranilate synthase, amidotransferase component n=2 Tax=Croceitalea TaxID=574891 RepID=A0A0P7AZ81_9FLAO|nr:Anthranilate synthase, amidotransferase component [Croceitalea dokdonensis DOKDO 023]
MSKNIHTGKSSSHVREPIKDAILMIDNYDSFTYNLVHYLEDLGRAVVVKRNDQLALSEVDAFDEIVLSPGPGIPDEAGLLKEIIRTYGATKRLFGVCLGQQAIGEVYGGTLLNLDQVYHGVSTEITTVVEDYIFQGMPKTLEVGRYHSWVVNSNLPKVLEATSMDKNGQIMSLRHREYDIRAVQFHPESVLTPQGKKILKNWLSYPGS